VKIIACGFLLFAFLHASAQAQADPAGQTRVLILTTGGTIASPADAPRIEGPVLVQAIPEHSSYASSEVDQFSLVGSSKLTPTHWLGLLNAVRVAISEQAIGHGVLIVLNEDISSARDVWKTNNRRVHTFGTSSAGYLGTVDPDGVEFSQRSLWPHTTQTEFDVSTLERLPRVALLSDFTGIDENLVIEFGEQDLDGLVIRTFAGGRMSAGMLAGLATLQAKGIPTAVTSRVPGGRIVGPPDYEFPAIVANGQPDNKARILLMLGLTRTTDRAELQRMFKNY
jgi:L-asparaginase